MDANMAQGFNIFGQKMIDGDCVCAFGCLKMFQAIGVNQTFMPDSSAGAAAASDYAAFNSWGPIPCGTALGSRLEHEYIYNGSIVFNSSNIVAQYPNSFTGVPLEYDPTNYGPNNREWFSVKAQITGPCDAFCIEWNIGGVTDYIQYGPLMNGETIIIDPIVVGGGALTYCSATSCDFCDGDGP
jgi:hypothetical protein